MMGIVVSETCWAYKKYNKIIGSIELVFILQLFKDVDFEGMFLLAPSYKKFSYVTAVQNIISV